MDANNKYYTPEIEEFGVGFEYEQKGAYGRWFKSIFGDSNEEYIGEYDNELSECYWELKSSNIRVKQLDKIDIENLGFINLHTTGTQRFKKYVNLKQFEGEEWFDYYLLLSLRYFDNTPHITIKKIDIHTYKEEIEVSDNVRSEYLFQGYVKNKHEFSKILKQIRLYGNTNNK